MELLVHYLTPWGTAILIAVLVMALESWLAGPDPLGFIRSLRQPSWALPFAGYVTVPFLFYGIAIYATVGAIQAGPAARGALALIVAVLLGNAFLNHLLCRRHRIDWAFRLAIPLVVVAAAAAVVVYAFDRTAGVLMGLVVLFVLYDVAWFAALARLNPEHAGRAISP